MHRGSWVEDAWLLYDTMEHKTTYEALRTSHIYTFTLHRTCLRLGPESENPVTLSGAIAQDPVTPLRNIVQQEIARALEISDRAFTSREEATEAICTLPHAALHLCVTNVMSKLILVGSLGKQAEDPLENVSEVTPVTKPKVCNVFCGVQYDAHCLQKIEMTHWHDGTLSHLVAEKPLQINTEDPFNSRNPCSRVVRSWKTPCCGNAYSSNLCSRRGRANEAPSRGVQPARSTETGATLERPVGVDVGVASQARVALHHGAAECHCRGTHHG